MVSRFFLGFETQASWLCADTSAEPVLGRLWLEKTTAYRRERENPLLPTAAVTDSKGGAQPAFLLTKYKRTEAHVWSERGPLIPNRHRKFSHSREGKRSLTNHSLSDLLSKLQPAAYPPLLTVTTLAFPDTPTPLLESPATQNYPDVHPSFLGTEGSRPRGSSELPAQAPNPQERETYPRWTSPARWLHEHDTNYCPTPHNAVYTHLRSRRRHRCPTRASWTASPPDAPLAAQQVKANQCTCPECLRRNKTVKLHCLGKSEGLEKLKRAQMLCVNPQRPTGPEKARPLAPAMLKAVATTKIGNDKLWNQRPTPANPSRLSPAHSPIPPPDLWYVRTTIPNGFWICLEYLLCELDHKIPHPCPSPLSLPKRLSLFDSHSALLAQAAWFNSLKW